MIGDKVQDGQARQPLRYFFLVKAGVQKLNSFGLN